MDSDRRVWVFAHEYRFPLDPKQAPAITSAGCPPVAGCVRKVKRNLLYGYMTNAKESPEVIS